MNTLSVLSAHFVRSAVDLFARDVAVALISSLWQGTILALITGLCLRLVPATTARLRFIVWTTVFVVLAALPLLNVVLTAHAGTAAPLSSVPHVQLAPGWSYALAAIWAAAVLIRLAHLVLHAIKLHSLWNSAVPMEAQGVPCDSVTQDVSRPFSPPASLTLKFRRRVQLCTSTEVDRPSVIGFFAPRILIPVWLVDQLTSGELEQIVLHELEHLRRRDDWSNLIQKVGLVLFPLNPALIWIDRRLATEREVACDDGVLSRTNAPRAYATCLAALAERCLEHRRHSRLTVLALGAVGAVRRSGFSRRIENILGFGGRATLCPALARALAMLLIIGVLGGAAELARTPQLVSFTAPTEPQASIASSPVFQAAGANPQPLSTRFESVAFHPARKPAGNSPAISPRREWRSKPHRVIPAARINAVYSEPIQSQRPNRSWMVLTSWRQSVPQPVLVALPDGRTFLATYAADPNQAGWLLIQL